MALRNLCSSLRPVFSSGSVRWASSSTSVFDKIIDVTVIDKAGRRHALRGVEGQTLADVLEANLDTLGDEAVVRSPEGRGAGDAHVKVPNELVHRVPLPTGDDARILSEMADPASYDAHHSRLASRIILDRSMKNSLIALGEHYPYKTL